MKTQYTLIKLALVALLACGAAWKAEAAATLTPATGGSSISADTTTASGGSSTYTTLTGPVLAEGAAHDISTGTIVLTAPSGFQFNTTANSVTVSVSGTGANIIITNNGTGLSATGGGSIQVTPTTSTITIGVNKVSSTKSTLTWSGINVVPTAGTPLAVNTNIVDTGTATINGLTLSTANWGTLTEVAGAASKLAFGVQPMSTSTNAIFTPAVTVQVQDQFGNLTTSSASVTVALGLNPGASTLSGIVTTNASSGTASFSTLSLNNAGYGYTLTASSSGLTGATSSSFDITTPTIAQRGSATTVTGTTSLTINKPTGVVQGDVMIATICASGGGSFGPPTNSTSWIRIDYEQLEGGGGHREGSVFYKVAGASEPSSYIFTFTNGPTASSGAIVAFSGVDTSGPTPFDVTPGTIQVVNSATVGAAAITTASVNAAAIMCGVAGGNVSFSGWTTTSPGSLTELFDNATSAGNGAAVGAAWATKNTVGSTGAGSATLSASKQNGGILLALKPSHVVAPTNSTTEISSSANPALPGASVTFTATVSGAGGTPTGTVQFKTNGVNFGSAVTLSSGSASSASVSTLPHSTTTSVTAVYSGDSSFAASTSSTLTQTINTAPAAGTHYITTTLNTAKNVSTATLTGLDTDADGDTLTITAVSSPSTQAGTVSLNGTGSTNITYTPASGFAGADSFTYGISDGFGGTNVCTVNVTVNLGKATSTFVSTATSNGNVNLRGYGIPTHLYDVHRSGTVSFTTYTNLTPSGVTAAANGMILYTDTNAPSPSYYRFAVH